MGQCFVIQTDVLAESATRPMLSKSFKYQPDDSTYIENNSFDFDTEFILETTRLKMSTHDLEFGIASSGMHQRALHSNTTSDDYVHQEPTMSVEWEEAFLSPLYEYDVDFLRLNDVLRTPMMLTQQVCKCICEVLVCY
jgi:hypothetical protein